MSKIIFLGPTLKLERAQEILEAEYRPPAKKGDFLRLATLSEGKHQVGLIDGVFLHDYPAARAALARLKHDDVTVAERFELYICGIELANAFSELIDPQEQRERFVKEIAERTAVGRPSYPLPEKFLAILAEMPPVPTPNWTGPYIGLGFGLRRRGRRGAGRLGGGAHVGVEVREGGTQLADVARHRPLDSNG